MVNDTPSESAIAKKHVSSVLIFLLNKGKVKKTDIVSVVHSNTTVDKLTSELSKEGYIEIKKEFAGRKTYEISLTDKGRRVAEQLKKAEAVMKGQKFPSTDRYAVILLLYRNGPMNLNEINNVLPGSTEILRDFENLKVVSQEIDSSKHPQETTISLTEKGMEIGKKIEELEKMIEERN